MNKNRLLIFIILALLCNTAISEELYFVNDNGKTIKQIYLDSSDLQLLKEKSEYFKIEYERFTKQRLELPISSINPDTFKLLLSLLSLNNTELIKKLEQTSAEKLYDIIRAADFLGIEKLQTIMLSKKKIKNLATYFVNPTHQDKLMSFTKTMCPPTSIYPISITQSMILLDTEPYISASWSPNGKKILALAEDVADIWNASTGHTEHTLTSKKSIYSASWSFNSKYIATTQLNHQADIWDVSTGKTVRILPYTSNIISVAWSPDGQYISTTSTDGIAQIWDTSTWQIKYRLMGHEGPITSLLWSPNSKYLVTGSDDNTAIIWDASTGQKKYILAGHAYHVYATAWSLDGNHIITTSGDGTARIWNSSTGQQEYMLSIDNNRILTASFSPDSEHIATTSFNGEIYIWNTITGKQEVIITIPAVKIHEISWSPDSKYLAAAVTGTIAYILNAATGQAEYTLAGHTRYVNSIAWSPDGAHVVTTSDDKTARIWHIPAVPDYMNLAELLISTAALNGMHVDRETLEILSGITIDMLLDINKESNVRINPNVERLLLQVKNARAGKKRGPSPDESLTKEAKKKKIMEED